MYSSAGTSSRFSGGAGGLAAARRAADWLAAEDAARGLSSGRFETSGGTGAGCEVVGATAGGFSEASIVLAAGFFFASAADSFFNSPLDSDFGVTAPAGMILRILSLSTRANP